MKLKKEVDGWWLVSDRPDLEDMGPYESRAEAQEDMAGVQKSLDWLDKREARKPDTK